MVVVDTLGVYIQNICLKIESSLVCVVNINLYIKFYEQGALLGVEESSTRVIFIKR